ncbi:hypothetical protein VNO77_02560 [Canavalia gladiata]|uniref:Uncharacterized protein n=1 Tax=Canavalia gladiata TaxID=3824 RepID=A0AAN9MTF8_CANGL
MHRVTGIRSLHYLFSIAKTAAETGLPTNNHHEKVPDKRLGPETVIRILSYPDEQTPIQAKAMHLVSCLSGLLAGITSDNHNLVSILRISKPMEHKVFTREQETVRGSNLRGTSLAAKTKCASLYAKLIFQRLSIHSLSLSITNAIFVIFLCPGPKIDNGTNFQLGRSYEASTPIQLALVID